MTEVALPTPRPRSGNLGNCVLIVDDSAIVRRGLRREFEGAGWIVCGEAENGRDAIAKAEALQPQVILLDLAMPEVNGLAAARLLKKALPETHLILLTAHGELFKSNEASSAGIEAVFSKGKPIAGLLDKAKSLVNGDTEPLMN